MASGTGRGSDRGERHRQWERRWETDWGRHGEQNREWRCVSVNETWPCQQLCLLTYETIISLTKLLPVPFFNSYGAVHWCSCVCARTRVCVKSRPWRMNHATTNWLPIWNEGANMLFCLGSLHGSAGTNQSNKLHSKLEPKFKFISIIGSEGECKYLLPSATAILSLRFTFQWEEVNFFWENQISEVSNWKLSWKLKFLFVYQSALVKFAYSKNCSGVSNNLTMPSSANSDIEKTR